MTPNSYHIGRAGVVAIAVAWLLAGPSAAPAPAQPVDVEELLYGDFRRVEGFWALTVSVDHNTEQLGLARTDLEDYARLRFRNEFAEMKIVDLPRLENGLPDWSKIGDSGSRALIRFDIRTVGEDYPIAFLVELEIVTLSRMACSRTVWDDSVFGYGAHKRVSGSESNLIKEAISTLTETAALKYFKLRGEL